MIINKIIVVLLMATMLVNPQGKDKPDPLVEKCFEETAYEVTDEEYQLLLRVCMSECGGIYGGEPLQGKIAVVETILNRVDMGMGTIEDVIAASYSTVDNGEPDETCVWAVNMALRRNHFPDNMIYFRTDHYHTFGSPYRQIGSHYFSLAE